MNCIDIVRRLRQVSAAEPAEASRLHAAIESADIAEPLRHNSHTLNNTLLLPDNSWLISDAIGDISFSAVANILAAFSFLRATPEPYASSLSRREPASREE